MNEAENENHCVQGRYEYTSQHIEYSIVRNQRTIQATTNACGMHALFIYTFVCRLFGRIVSSQSYGHMGDYICLHNPHQKEKSHTILSV